MKDLRETIDMMNSSDFKDRVKAEYHQLVIRCKKLEDMCKKYAAGELDFKPNCPLELLQKQLDHMQGYKEILEIRADIEGIDLSVTDDEKWGEPVRDLEQEYAEQAESEQACEACEECCDCCNDTGTAEPAENKKTYNEDCTPPVDREWENETESYRSKSFSFSSPDKLKEKMTSKVDIPDNADRLFIHITEEEDGHLQSVIIGNSMKVIPALETVFAETATGIFKEDAPDFIKKLMVITTVGNLKNKMLDALKCSEKK